MTKEECSTISIFQATDIESHAGELGALLYACVHDGASVSFVLPYTKDDSVGFWTEKVLPAVRNGRRTVIVARQGERITGAVQLDYDLPPNQPHRAEVCKLLVRPEFRRQGIAIALMAELERVAIDLGLSLITLDTRTGDKAEPLYASLGFLKAGVIPHYARDPIEDRFDSTTIMYKELES